MVQRCWLQYPFPRPEARILLLRQHLGRKSCHQGRRRLRSHRLRRAMRLVLLEDSMQFHRCQGLQTTIKSVNNLQHMGEYNGYCMYSLQITSNKLALAKMIAPASRSFLMTNASPTTWPPSLRSTNDPAVVFIPSSIAVSKSRHSVSSTLPVFLS